MIKRTFLVISLILTLSTLIKSQERKDLGIQAGGAYYVGDYNVRIPFYQPSFGFGIIYRYNLNKYNSFRVSANYEKLRGRYEPSKGYLPGLPSSFSKQVFEMSGLYEINFMSFNTKHLNKDNFSPYVIFGLGVAYIGGDIIPNLPFGFGIKYCPASRVTVGFDWKLSKTFNDKIDNYQSVNEGTKAFLHNNDWFSFAGIFITYRLYNYKNNCPVYK